MASARKCKRRKGAKAAFVSCELSQIKRWRQQRTKFSIHRCGRLRDANSNLESHNDQSEPKTDRHRTCPRRGLDRSPHCENFPDGTGRGGRGGRCTRIPRQSISITRSIPSAPVTPRKTRAFCRRLRNCCGFCRDILIVGPGTEKAALLHYLQVNRKDLTATQLHAEASDHPTDREIIAIGRRRFGLDLRAG